MQVRIHTYAHTHTHKHTHAHTHTYTRTYTHTHMHAHAHTHIKYGATNPNDLPLSEVLVSDVLAAKVQGVHDMNCHLPPLALSLTYHKGKQ